MSVFRPQYRELTDREKELVGNIKTVAESLYELMNEAPDGRYKSLAKTALEESVMWSVKGVTG